jgi:pyruvate/2-oxoglutarate/acetoin dehydrogenase E1 component
VQAKAFASLEAPIERVCGFDTPFPYTLEEHYLPSAERILDALVRTIEY